MVPQVYLRKHIDTDKHRKYNDQVPTHQIKLGINLASESTRRVATKTMQLNFLILNTQSNSLRRITTINADLLNSTNFNNKIIRNLVETNALSFVSIVPTHHLHHLDPPSYTTLDLFIVNHTKTLIDFTKSKSSSIAGHDFIELTLSNKNPQPLPKTINTRNLRNINITELQNQFFTHLRSSDV